MSAMMNVEPITLTGYRIRLEPLQLEHADALLQTAYEAATWDYMPVNPSHSLDAMQQWIQSALLEQQAGSGLPFVIIDRVHDKVIGSTRYLDIVPAHWRLEIGWTWLAPEVRGSGVNTDCKYALLQHAFETLGAIRVQLKTDSRNLRSQRAIERLGAVKEGVLRNHVIMPDGYRRHSVYYSILDSEWPQVKAGLTARIQSFQASH